MKISGQGASGLEPASWPDLGHRFGDSLEILDIISRRTGGLEGDLPYQPMSSARFR